MAGGQIQGHANDCGLSPPLGMETAFFMLPLLPCLSHFLDLIIFIIISPRWGFHDRLLTLRSALANFLNHGKAVQAIYRRWRWQVIIVIIAIVTIANIDVIIIIIFLIAIILLMIRQLLRTGSQGWD